MSAELKIEDERARERQTDREAKRNRESRKAEHVLRKIHHCTFLSKIS